MTKDNLFIKEYKLSFFSNRFLKEIEIHFFLECKDEAIAFHHESCFLIGLSSHYLFVVWSVTSLVKGAANKMVVSSFCF